MMNSREGLLSLEAFKQYFKSKVEQEDTQTVSVDYREKMLNQYLESLGDSGIALYDLVLRCVDYLNPFICRGYPIIYVCDFIHPPKPSAKQNQPSFKGIYIFSKIHGCTLGDNLVQAYNDVVLRGTTENSAFKRGLDLSLSLAEQAIKESYASQYQFIRRFLRPLRIVTNNNYSGRVNPI